MIKVCLNQGTNIRALGLPSWLCLSFASFLFPQTSIPSVLAVARVVCLALFLPFLCFQGLGLTLSRLFLGGTVSLNAGWPQGHSLALASLLTGALQVCLHHRFSILLPIPGHYHCPLSLLC